MSPSTAASSKALPRNLWRRAARNAYATTLRLATPLYLARQWQRGWVEPGYRHGLGERLGLYPPPPQAEPTPAQNLIWVHAASLGEVRAAAPLIDALRAKRPSLSLLLTHRTSTGRAVGGRLLRPGDHQAWLPYDTPGAVRRFLRQFRPTVGVLVEAELWPVLIHEARDAGVPMLLANARHLERPTRAQPRLQWLMPPPIDALQLVLAQTDHDAQRIRAAGAGEVLVCGDLGADISPHPRLLARGLQWRQRLTRPVVLLAGSRENEERAFLAAWKAAPAPRPLLLLLPRHLQRAEEVAALADAQGLSWVRRSSWGERPNEAALAHTTDLWLCDDAPAHAALYYGCADVALLGGSFAPMGGGNPVEAAACGCPLLMGPNTFRHAQAARGAEQSGAALRVGTIEEAVPLAIDMACGDQRNRMVRASLSFAHTHRGAAQLMAEQVLRMQRSLTDGTTR